MKARKTGGGTTSDPSSVPAVVRRVRSFVSPLAAGALTLSAVVLAGCSESPVGTSTTELVPIGQVAFAKGTTLNNGAYFGEPVVTAAKAYKNVPIFSNYYKFRSGMTVPSNTQAYVDVAGNVTYSPTITAGKTATGLAFECVEYVRRFYLRVYNILPPANVNAGDFWGQSAAKMGALRRVTDGYSTILPQPGDIVVMGNTSNGSPSAGDGHVNIVVSVSRSLVSYSEQNTSSPSNQKSVTIVKLAGSDRYKLGPIGSTSSGRGYYTKGWFSRATHPSSVPRISGFAPAGLKVSTKRVTLALLTTGIVDLDDVVITLTDPASKKTTYSIANGTIRPTPLGVVFDALLVSPGSWTVQLSAGSGTAAKVSFTVTR